MALTESDQTFRLRIKVFRDYIEDQFEELGLIEFSKCQPDNFYITDYMRKFLVDQVTPERQSPTLPVNSVSNSTDKFIIVESNFRVFAYTNDQKYIAILKLFLETSKEIHNP